MDLPTRAFDSFKVEEAYNWRDDVMEITRRIVHETDEARLSNIANHFEVDLSEIRAFLEMRQRQQRKPQTNADRIRAMSDEELADFLCDISGGESCTYCVASDLCHNGHNGMIEWLKEEAEGEET